MQRHEEFAAAGLDGENKIIELKRRQMCAVFSESQRTQIVETVLGQNSDTALITMD